MATYLKYEDWAAYAWHIKNQLAFCQERLETHRHLLKTQEAPANLPAVISKWEYLRLELLNEAYLHGNRGKRQKLVTDEQLHYFFPETFKKLIDANGNATGSLQSIFSAWNNEAP